MLLKNFNSKKQEKNRKGKNQNKILTPEDQLMD